MDKGTHNQINPPFAGLARRVIWALVWPLALCGWWLPLQVWGALPGEALPGEAAPVLQSRVWPPAVYVGERFAYRVELRHQSGVALLQPGTLHIGNAQLQGKLQIQQRQDRLILKLPLAIFLVKQYGAQHLPPFALTFRTPAGEKKLWFPAATLEVRARYAATKRFRLRQDPQLPFEPDSASAMPSHEWRSLPIPPALATQTSWPLSWWLGGLSVLLALGLWGLIMWQRKKEPVPARPASPYQEAKEHLQSLRQARDRESLRQSCTDILFVLRDYLQKRLGLPTRHLTAHELCHYLEERSSHAEGQPIYPWFEQLERLLLRSEPLCFAPPTAPLNPAHTMPAQQQRALQILDTIEAWQVAQEQALEALATNEASQPNDPSKRRERTRR